MSNLKAFVGYGEKNLVDTFCTCFSEANQLSCTTHMENNISKKGNDFIGGGLKFIWG